MNSASSAAVEKIQRCHLSQRQLCLINPRTGAKTEIVVKQSLEHSIARQHLRGTIRLTDPIDKRRAPDLFLLEEIYQSMSDTGHQPRHVASESTSAENSTALHAARTH